MEESPYLTLSSIAPTGKAVSPIPPYSLVHFATKTLARNPSFILGTILSSASEARAVSCFGVAFCVHGENNLQKEGLADMWIFRSNPRQTPEIGRDDNGQPKSEDRTRK